ncbi:unnamed protein product, partial [Pylaiella littoralis]
MVDNTSPRWTKNSEDNDVTTRAPTLSSDNAYEADVIKLVRGIIIKDGEIMQSPTNSILEIRSNLRAWRVHLTVLGVGVVRGLRVKTLTWSFGSMDHPKPLKFRDGREYGNDIVGVCCCVVCCHPIHFGRQPTMYTFLCADVLAQQPGSNGREVKAYSREVCSFAVLYLH